MQEDEREASRAKSDRDREDFNNEIAGRETGRMRRFLPEDLTPTGEKARREDRDRFFLAVVLSLQARIQQFRERLDELDRASLLALRHAERRVQDAETVLERLRECTTRDSSGRLVYRTADGSTGFYEDGRRLTEDEYLQVRWREDAPTWEQKQHADEERRRTLRELDDVGAYRDRLHTIRDRIESGQPLGEDELRELEDELRDAPGFIANELPHVAALGALASEASGSTEMALRPEEASELAAAALGPASSHTVDAQASPVRPKR